MKLATFTTLFVVTAGTAQALVPGDCTRTTHISHGGEAGHTDLGEGRVMWRDWWSQEGTATKITVMECGSGQMLRARTAEENMNARTPFDRTDDALAVIGQHESGGRVFATLERIAADLGTITRDVTLSTGADETCACAAFYPGLRGDRNDFRLTGLN